MIDQKVEEQDVFDRIDLREQVIYHLSTVTRLHNYVDKVFSKNSVEYTDKHKKSEIYNSKILELLTIPSRLIAEKINGIVAWEEERYSQPPTMLALIKKGFKIPYNFYMNKKVINMDEFADHLLENKIGNRQDARINHMVLLYLCDMHGFEKMYIEISSDEELDLESHIDLLRAYKKYGTKLLAEGMKDVPKEEIAKHVERAQVAWPYKENKMTAMRYLSDFPKLDESTFTSLSKHAGLAEANKLRAKVITESLGPSISIYELLGYGFPLDLIALLNNTEVKKNEIIHLATLYGRNITNSANNVANSNVLMKFITSCIYIKAIGEEYKSLGEKYLDLNNKYSELLYKECETDSAESVVETKTEVVNLGNDKDAEKIRHLEKKVRQLEEELAERESHKQELAALRSHVYETDNEVEIATPSLEAMIERIQDKKVVIIGGHQVWLAKVKKLLPNVRFLEASSKSNISFDSIRKSDVLLLNTSQVKHAHFHRAIKEAESGNVRVRFVSEHVNEELSIKDIYTKTNDI